MAYSGSYGGISHSCRSYCNVSGYYNAGFQCSGLFCCGSLNVRFCCSNSSLDISNAYPEKCRCAMSSCSYLSWDVLLPCVAAALFVLLMVTICCCQGCRSCVKCRQVFRRQCLHTNSSTVSNGPGGSAANLEDGQHTASDSTFPHLPPYEFGPPKYESIELAEAPPKYEDIMTPGGGQSSETHVNSAFVGDSDTHDYSATPEYSVTSDRTVTDESRPCDTLVPGTSGPLRGDNDGRASNDGPVAKNSEVPALLNTDGVSKRLQANQLNESSLNSHELTPNTDSETSTCPDQVICQEGSTCDQVGGIDRPVNADSEMILQVVAARTPSEGRTGEHEV